MDVIAELTRDQWITSTHLLRVTRCVSYDSLPVIDVEVLMNAGT